MQNGISQKQKQENLLRKLKEEEHRLHDQLVLETQKLQRAKQDLAQCEESLEETLAMLNQVRDRMNMLWQAAP